MAPTTPAATPSTTRDLLGRLNECLLTAVRQHYGTRLWTLAVYGSCARGAPRPDSDIDVLLIADDLPAGRVARAEGFVAVEDMLAPFFEELRELDLHWYLSPVFKTREEVAAGSPLFLDMTEDALLLFDRDGYFAAVLERLRGRLEELGARRVWRGNAWYWDLKPDYEPGEVFEL